MHETTGVAVNGTTWSIFRRWLRQFLLVAIPLSVAIAVPAYLEHRAAWQLHRELGRHLVELHASVISQEVHAAASDLRYLARQATLRRFVSGESDLQTELEQEYVRFCTEKGIYDQIRFLDLTGMEVIRINNGPQGPNAVARAELQPKGSRYYFENAMRLKDHEVFVSPFDLNMERGEIERPLKPVIRFAAPVVDASGQRRGLLVLNLMGNGLLQKLRQIAQPFPGSAWLVNEEGDYLIGPSSEVEWDFMLNQRGITLQTQYPVAWRELSSGPTTQLSVEAGQFSAQGIWVGSLTRSDVDPPVESSLAGPKLMAVSYIPHATVQAGPQRLLLRLLLVYVIALTALALVNWYLVLAAEQRRAQELQLQEAHVRLRQLTARLISAQEDERRKLSRDLHDDFGQILASVTMDLELAQHTQDLQRRVGLVGQALQATRGLADKIHEKATEVRPSLLDDVGLRSSVLDLLHRFESRYDLLCDADLHFEQERVPVTVRENVYRILQESLTNIVRHAGVREASVELRVTPNRVLLKVNDRGAGFLPEKQDHQRLGVLGMRERVELLGGVFQLVSAPGQGTRITVEIPIVPDAKNV